jgi:uncharacterized RDD family membrane protein YckC
MALPFRARRDSFGHDAMQWYYANEGQRSGPVSADEFTRLVETGVIRADTLVWRAGMPTWKPYAELAPPPLATAPILPPSPAPAQAVAGVDAGSAPVAGAHDVVMHGYGGFWRRLVAKVIDGFITNILAWIILIPILFATLGTAGLFSPGDEPTPEQLVAVFGFQLFSIGVQTVIGLLYSIVFLKKYSATPGKMLLGLKVYRADSGPLSVGRIVARYFAEWLSGIILMIGYIIAAFDPEKRALHDRIVDTRVVVVRP